MRDEPKYVCFDATITGLVFDAALAVFGGIATFLVLKDLLPFAVLALFGIVMLLVIKAFLYKNL